MPHSWGYFLKNSTGKLLIPIVHLKKEKFSPSQSNITIQSCIIKYITMQSLCVQCHENKIQNISEEFVVLRLSSLPKKCWSAAYSIGLSPIPRLYWAAKTCHSDFVALAVSKLSLGRICKAFKEPRNRFLAWRICRTSLSGYTGWRNCFLGSIIV